MANPIKVNVPLGPYRSVKTILRYISITDPKHMLVDPMLMVYGYFTKLNKQSGDIALLEVICLSITKGLKRWILMVILIF